MTAPPDLVWTEANQRYLATALEEVRGALQTGTGVETVEGGGATVPPSVSDTMGSMQTPPALETICATFGLSPFERSVLLLCAAPELDASFGSLLAAAQGDPARRYPTFSLALAALPGAHWSALTPTAPLRRWRLVDVGAGTSLTESPLRIDERVLHFLAGVHHMDERLAGFVEPVHEGDGLVPSHRRLADLVVAAWTAASRGSVLPVVQLCGSEPAGKRAVAAAACATLGLNLASMRGAVLPLDPRELDALVRLWEREAALGGSALILDCDETEPADLPRETAVALVVEGMRSPLFLTGRERRPVGGRPVVTLEVRKPTTSEQGALWRGALGPGSADGQVDRLVSQFDLGAWSIRSASAQVLRGGELEASTEGTGDALWEACRHQARPKMDDLAHRIEAVAEWEDLVLPEGQRAILQEIALQVRQRVKVYETWGFAKKSTRGLGISALFAGASGTGKTLAAEVLAGELHLDLYRIDLSQVVSKYIGETEKNLRKVFDAAEEGGAVLLFDEADALFGKRSEVKDSHDRYANIEIGYLLQRMEAYRGLAILTTNMKEALDPAFLRRIRFVVHFPFPDPSFRAEIWRRVLPSDAPTEGLDFVRLARLNVAGGTIRNIAVNAAFLAAEADGPIRMSHILRAARSEYAKLERTLTGAEIGGWA